MRLFFDTVIDTQLARLTPERTAQLYVDFRVGRSVDYHRNTLGNAKGFLAWCVAQGWVQTNALAAVEGVGRRSVGKEQLTGDEARKLHDWCMWRARRGDEAAIGVLMLLLMALRQSDVTKRLVRDVDLDATVLRVSGGKTRRRANRPRRCLVCFSRCCASWSKAVALMSLCSPSTASITPRHGSSRP